MHIGGFASRQRQIRDHRICADRRTDRAALPAAAHHRPHSSHYNVGAQTRRTENVAWHREDRLEIHPHDAETARRPRWRLGEARKPRRAKRRCAPRSPIGWRRAWSTRPSIIRKTQANVVTTDYSDWATNCPEYKVTAVQVSRSNGPSEWQEKYREQAEQSRRIIHTSKRRNERLVNPVPDGSRLPRTPRSSAMFLQAPRRSELIRR